MKYDNLIRRIIRETIEENIPMPDGTVVPYTNSIYDANHKKVNGSVNIDGKDRWISRSNNVHLFLYCRNENGEWCLLASQRGRSGKWNAVAGFLDYYESLAKAAARECFEETGVKLDVNKLNLLSINDNPKEDKRQNVTFRYYCTIDTPIEDIKLSDKNSEQQEVEDIMWIPLRQIPLFKWAFNHDKILKEFIKYHVYIN